MRYKYIIIGVILLGLIAIFFQQNTNIEKVPDDIIEENIMDDLNLTSTAFSEGESIPSVFTCDGENKNPPLSVEGVPEDAKSLVLIMDDPDIPEVFKKARLIEKFDHWVLFNLPIETKEIAENYKEGTVGVNSAGSLGYTGPCPPTEYEPTEHRYVFQLYALDVTLELEEGAKESDVRSAMKGHILSNSELIVLYDRKTSNN